MTNALPRILIVDRKVPIPEKKGTFLRILQIFIENCDSRGRFWSYYCWEFSFLFTYRSVIHSSKLRAGRFQHSQSIIRRIVNEIIHSFLMCKDELFRFNLPHSRFLEIPTSSHSFSTALGLSTVATQMLHLHPFRNRKCWLSQHVLAVCDFDMLTTWYKNYFG